MDFKDLKEAAETILSAAKDSPTLIDELEKAAKKMAGNKKNRSQAEGIHQPIESTPGQSIVGVLSRLGETAGAKAEVKRVTQEAKDIKPKLNKDVHPETSKGVSDVGASVRASNYMKDKNPAAASAAMDHAKTLVRDGVKNRPRTWAEAFHAKIAAVRGAVAPTQKMDAIKAETFSLDLLKSDTKMFADLKKAGTGQTLGQTIGYPGSSPSPAPSAGLAQAEKGVKEMVKEEWKPRFFKGEIGSQKASMATKIIKPKDVSDHGAAGFKVAATGGTKAVTIENPKGKPTK
jgi:hypothetical protein